MLDDVVCKLQLLSLGSFLEASLHDAASVFVGSDGNTVHHASLENVLSIYTSEVASWLVNISRMRRSLKDHKESLNNMISMHVHNEVNNFFVERPNDLHHDIMRKTLSYEILIGIESFMIFDDLLR